MNSDFGKDKPSGDVDAGNEPEAARGTIFLNDVTKIDCAIFDPSKGVFGQTWRVDVSVSGPIGRNGCVYDFSLLKALVRQVLKTSVDHALVIPINSQSVQYKGVDKGECWLMKSRPSKTLGGGGDSEWEYRSPTGTVYPSRSVAMNRQVVEQEIVRMLRHRLPQEIQTISVALREEESSATEAFIRYTHGIAGHDGACQRLFHGHRCRLQIYVGEERRPDLEHYVARDVLGTHVHIAAPSQFKAGSIPVGTRGKTREPVTLAYEGTQGAFEATLPADRVFVVEGETSIECIAREIARLVKREENTAEKVRILCYEGIDKGAVAEA
jgi:6-pyruvoyl-tetrahydropterin synthase